MSFWYVSMQKLTFKIFIIVARAQSSTRQCLRDNIFFTLQLCFRLETERKFTEVA